MTPITVPNKTAYQKVGKKSKMGDIEKGMVEFVGRDAFVRNPARKYAPRPDDPRIEKSAIDRFRIAGGETVEFESAKNAKRGKSSLIGSIVSINDRDAQDYAERKPFADLTAIRPEKQMRFETADGPTSTRLIDLLTPIGFGQRGLIVAPPRTGKTVLLQQLAHGVAANYPDVFMLVLLIDERPEEVTEMTRSVRGEVFASSNDEAVQSHIRLAKLISEKAKRLVECGRDVFLLIDSLTRIGRAFNSGSRGGGRTMSGGLDSRAMEEPKSIFGAARTVEGGGSLTTIASALIETGSRMDEVIFNEFKGTGNMELVLSRELANMRLYPAIDLAASGTRHEELLLSPAALAASTQFRRTVMDRGPQRGMEMLLEEMGNFKTNDALVAASAPSPSPGRRRL